MRKEPVVPLVRYVSWNMAGQAPVNTWLRRTSCEVRELKFTTVCSQYTYCLLYLLWGTWVEMVALDALSADDPVVPLVRYVSWNTIFSLIFPLVSRRTSCEVRELKCHYTGICCCDYTVVPLVRYVSWNQFFDPWVVILACRTSCEVRELKSSTFLQSHTTVGRTSCEVRELKSSNVMLNLAFTCRTSCEVRELKFVY